MMESVTPLPVTSHGPLTMTPRASQSSETQHVVRGQWHLSHLLGMQDPEPHLTPTDFQSAVQEDRRLILGHVEV